MPSMEPLSVHLEIIPKIERGMGVVAVQDNLGAPLLCFGDVAVYSEDFFSHFPLVEGIYCIQYQSTTACMPRADWARHFVEGTASQLEIRRSVVQVRRCPYAEDRWITQPLGPQGFRGGYFVVSDGPFDDVHLINKLLGPVIGIYRPAPISEARS